MLPYSYGDLVEHIQSTPVPESYGCRHGNVFCDAVSLKLQSRDYVMSKQFAYPWSITTIFLLRTNFTGLFGGESNPGTSCLPSGDYSTSELTVFPTVEESNLRHITFH